MTCVRHAVVPGEGTMRNSLFARSRACGRLSFLLLLASCGGGGGSDSGGTALYSVGGSVSGLSGALVLQINGGSGLNISTDGPFTFPVALANGSAYAVTVLTQPA